MTFSAQFNDGVNANPHHVSAARDGEAGKRCSMDFGMADEKVAVIKVACGAAMQTIINARDGTPNPAEEDAKGREEYGNAMRYYDKALTQLEYAQMFAVKGLFAKK